MHKTHPELVFALAKSGDDIARHLYAKPELAHLWHMVTCIAGEAGELIDIVKKMAIYGQEYNPERLEHFIEEMGDLEFYLEGARQGFSRLAGREVTREEIVHQNMVKLSIRYGLTYSDKAAEERRDKDPSLVTTFPFSGSKLEIHTGVPSQCTYCGKPGHVVGACPDFPDAPEV